MGRGMRHVDTTSLDEHSSVLPREDVEGGRGWTGRIIGICHAGAPSSSPRDG